MQRKKIQKLRIDDKEIVIMKEIPPRLLKKRSKYNYLTEALKKNNINFKWEFPEGITFTYKQIKRRLTTELDVEKFWRKYEKFLGGGGKAGDKKEVKGDKHSSESEEE